MNDKIKIMNGREIIIFARSLSPSLGTKERIVASYIAEHYKRVAEMTVNQLADFLKVSESSIIKVCKKLNIDGYYTLRRELKEYVDEQESELQEDFNQDDTPMDVVKKVFYDSILALQDTLSILNEDEFTRAVNAFDNVNKVLLFGLGGSGSIADDISHKFLKVGIDSYYYRDINMQAMAASMLKSGDVAIGISHSGSTKPVIDAMNVAKKAGATTICVTNYIKSPITEVADIKLVSSARNSLITGENAVTRIVHLNIMDALYVSVVLKHKDKAMENLKKTHDAVFGTN